MAGSRTERTPAAAPLLGEWACLGILYDRPAHGWAVAARLLPDSDIGRIWTIKRPITYRSLDQLTRRGWIAPVGNERGDAGPNRTILGATRAGRSRFRAWTCTPVAHLRDLRSELLLKFVLADLDGIDITEMLDRQREIIDRHATSLSSTARDASDTVESHAAVDPDAAGDVVNLWRIESTRAAQRFIDRIHPAR